MELAFQQGHTQGKGQGKREEECIKKLYVLETNKGRVRGQEATGGMKSFR